MSEKPPKADRGAALRTVWRHRRAIGLDGRLLLIVCVLAVVTGFGQAATLIIVVRAATALTAETDLISGDVGPFTATDLTLTQLVFLGFVTLGVLLIAEVAMAYGQASLQARALRGSRHRVLTAFGASSYTEQVALARGDIQTVINSHTTRASTLAGQLAMTAVSALNFATLVLSALVLSLQTAGLVVACIAVVLIFLRPLLDRTRRISARRTTEARRLGSSLLQRLELAREIRSFGVDVAATQSVLRSVDLVARMTQRQRFYNRLSSVLFRVGSLAIVLVILLIVNASGAKNLASLAGALLLLLRSMSYGQAAQSAYQSVNESVPEVLELVMETDRLRGADPASATGTQEPEELGDLAFEDVSFAYPDGVRVLDGVSFEVKKGDLAALVGPSGAGKSTIMALLLRLFEPTAGAVVCGSHPASRIAPAWWHRHVAYVPQDSKLHDGTVAEAIRFYRDWVSDDDIRRAARMAHISDEIESWADGYSSEVGQLGDQLSGGQRQRIALARALAGNPELLLLDEPTSALDPVSERLISETLDELRGTMTIVVIAHRYQTVERANRVIHVDGGRIVPSERVGREEIRRLLET